MADSDGDGEAGSDGGGDGDSDTVYQVSGPMPTDKAAQLQEVVFAVAEQLQISPPVVSSFEDGPSQHQVDIFFAGAIDRDFIAALVRALDVTDWAATEVKLEPRDWVAESQRHQPPIVAGRFFVHGQHDAAQIPEDSIGILVEAGQAFGTGRHETTWACLTVLDALEAHGVAPLSVLDLGTGTGLLAIAAGHLWPDAQLVASDIDPVAIDVMRANVRDNGLQPWLDTGRMRALVADGLDHPGITDAAPYDLIVANILAGPLMVLAPPITAACSAGGLIILSGLMAFQGDEVLAAYAAQGWHEEDRVQKGEWLALTLHYRSG